MTPGERIGIKKSALSSIEIGCGRYLGFGSSYKKLDKYVRLSIMKLQRHKLY